MEKNNKDAFGDLSYNNSDVYANRNKNVARANRAKEIDKRIENFYNTTRDLEWANKAVDFCDREEENGKDVADLSIWIKELPRIRQEAQDIINADKKKKKDEQEALRLKQIQQDLKNKEKEDKLIADTIDEISALNNMAKDMRWVNAVERVELTLKGLPKATLERVTNRFVLDNHLTEKESVKNGIELDAKIVELGATKLKNRVWAQKIFALEKELTPKLDSYMNEKTRFYDLLAHATKIYYGEDITEIEDFITDVESGNIDLDTYASVVKLEEKTSNEIYLGEYIDNFEKRWKNAKKACDDLIKENKKQAQIEADIKKKKEDDAKKKRQEEIAKKKEEDRIKEEKKAKAAKTRKVLGVLGVRALELGVLATVLVLGLTNFSQVWGQYVLSVGLAVVVAYVFLRFSSSTVVGIINPIVSSLVTVFGIVSTFVPVLKAFTFPMIALGLLLTTFSMFVAKSELSYDFFLVELQSVALSLALYFTIGGIFGAVAAAGSIIVMTLLSKVYANFADADEEIVTFIAATFAYIFAIATIPFAIIGGWPAIIVGGGALIASVLQSCFNPSMEYDEVWFFMLLIVVGISAFILIGSIMVMSF